MTPDGAVRTSSITQTRSDPALRPFLDADDETDADRELAVLIEREALPLARVIVNRKLRSYPSTRRRGRADDREDVVSEAMVALVQRLRRARTDPDAEAIANFGGYVAAVVHSTCAHAIRRTHPERARLKDRFRYVFSADSRLAIWSSDDSETLCGVREWSGRPADDGARKRVADLLRAGARNWTQLEKREFATATVDLLRAAEGPLELDALVGEIATASRLVEPQEADGAEHLEAGEPAIDVLIDQRRLLQRVWDEVRSLPHRQRTALLLNLRDSSGRGLLWLLPVSGVATLREIASTLEIPTEEFAALWRDIPLDDAAIARRLGCERQQVINLRMSARKRLWNRAGPESIRRRFPAPLRKDEQ